MPKGSPALRRGAPARFAMPVGIPAPASPESLPPIKPADVRIDPETASNVRPFVPPATTPLATLEPPTIEDCDQLWDWVRADRDGTTAFLGKAHPNSGSFGEHVGSFFAAEDRKTAWFRSIRTHDALAGFLLISPIVAQPQMSGTLHLYIAPHAQADMASWLPALIQQLPSDMLLMMVDRGAFADLLAPLGFEAHTVLTRPVSTQAVPRERM